MTDPIEANRALWDEWSEIHASSDFYDLSSFISGEHGIRLQDYELEEIGDVAGKDLLHIQCHIGTQTLSWARLGANVTGTDFSEVGLAKARELADAIDVPARFVRSETYKLPEVLQGEFDIVYMSGGVLGWLPDMAKLGEVVAHYVKRGGFFYIAEVHPVTMVFDEESKNELKLKWPYWTHEEPLAIETEGSYADRTAELVSTHEYGWNHSLGEIVTGFARAGLRIDSLREYPFVHWPVGFLEEVDGRWVLPSRHDGELPLYFSLKASKP